MVTCLDWHICLLVFIFTLVILSYMLTNGRLPKNIYPLHYSLNINVNLDRFTFEGDVSINLRIKDYYKNNFCLHSDGLEIKKVLFDKYETNFTIDIHQSLLIVNLKENINPSSIDHNLQILYTGKINDDLKGFYKSNYTINNKVYYIATTQFEPADARKAFPCFDEPCFKSIFDISIVAPIEKTVLSNTNVMKITNISATNKKVVFETTPLMSSYLVAFIIGDFCYVEKSSPRIIVRIYGTQNNFDKMNFALDVTIKALNWYEKWFDVKYPLSKLDMIGIPDFNSGAMENWGLITFRPELLFCTKNTELSYKENIVTTICHELAHQWFGNLVTMEWWSYLWLNESMATYFGWLVCDKLFPEWNVWSKFMDHEYSHALNLDSLESSHPVEVQVENSKDLNQIFDGISYSKGSCLVRFLAEYLGEETFQKGMRKYISSNAYGNTTSKNLWEVFDDKAYNISKMMETWTKQTGYPVIMVSTKGNSIVLKQRKFLRSGIHKDKTKWIVPIKISSISNEQNFLLDESEITINDFEYDSFVVNPNRLGFYRVMYENVPFNIRDLSDQIKRQVIADSFSLAFSGYQSMTIPFGFIKKIDLFTLRDDGLWETILSGLLKTLKLLESYPKEYNFIKSYITILIIPHIKKLFKEVGWEDLSGETFNVSNLRPILIDFLNYMEDVDIINDAKHLFSQSKYKYVLSIVGTHSTKQEYDKLLELLDHHTDPHLKNQIIDALGSTKNEVFIDFTINNVLLSKIRTQDIWNLIRSLSNNKNATNKNWTFCKNHWNDILVIYNPGSSGLTHVVKVIASGFNTHEQLEDYIKFFKIRPEGTNMVINQTIENVNNKIMSLQRVISEIKLMNKN